MRICLVSSYLPPRVGGAETYVSEVSTRLAQRGHQVTIVSGDRPSRPGTTVVGRVKAVRVRTLTTLYGTPLFLMPREAYAGHFDVMHANFPSPYLAAASGAIGSLTGVPRVLTWHNDLPSVTHGARVLVRVHDAISPAYLRLYQRIIATTRAYAEASPTLRRFREKVTVIPNGVDTQRFNPGVDGAPVRRRFGLEGSIVALFVGDLSKWHGYKGLDVLIRSMRSAATAVPRLRLLVVGEGKLRSGYESLAREVGASDLVTFAGYAAAPELPSFYSAADFCVLPSKDPSEGFGLTLLEAMAAGKPVIGSKVGGIVDVISGGENGLLVPPKDPAALAEAMVSMARGDMAAMGRKGRLAAQGHDWEVTVDRLEALYEEVAEPQATTRL